MNIFKKTFFQKTKNSETNDVIQNDFSRYDDAVKFSDAEINEEVKQPLYPQTDINDDTVLLKNFEPDDFGVTVLLNADDYKNSDETVLLNSNVEEKSTEVQNVSIEWILNRIYLINPLSGEKVHINKQIFTIGSGNDVNCKIDKSSVSSNHASIFIKNPDEFYIVDNSSTNGTQLEGVSIEPMKMVLIENGDLITFGEELYQFYIEE